MTLTAVGADAAPRRRVPLLALAAALYAGCAALLSPQTFWAVLGTYLGQALVLPPIVLVGLCAAAMILRPRAPVGFMVEVMRNGLLRFLAILFGFCIAVSAFTTLKLAIPHVVPFYADPPLADLDAALHGGFNPGDLAHMVLPQWAEYPLAWCYGPLWFLLWFGLAAFVALHGNAELRARYFWSLGLVLVLIGSLLATVLSSVGPIFYAQFYGGDRFAALAASLESSSVGAYLREATGYLLANYARDGHALGTGISAMPSMHLAVATLNANMLGSINRVAGGAGWLYVLVILFESVYLGWHYAIDGYLSIALVCLFWWGGGRLARRSVRRNAWKSGVLDGAAGQD